MKIKINYIIIIFGIVLLSLLPSCTLTQYTPDLYVYEDQPHSTEVYYRGGTYSEPGCSQWPYWGFYEGFYYYYGIPHFYPWWYYYQFIPPYHYYVNTHITIIIDSGYYVYGHRGPKFHNIGPDCKINYGKFTPSVKLKGKNDKAIVFPRNWKSSNSTRETKQNELKYNINKLNYNRTFNGKSNQTYNKHNNTTNINKNNTINKGNNGSTRPNKTNTSRKPKR